MSYRRPFANRNGISLFISNSSWSTVACSQQQGRSILCRYYIYILHVPSFRIFLLLTRFPILNKFFSLWNLAKYWEWIGSRYLLSDLETLPSGLNWIFWGAVLYNFVQIDFALRTTTPYQHITHCKCSVFVMITRSAPLLLKVMRPH